MENFTRISFPNTFRKWNKILCIRRQVPETAAPENNVWEFGALPLSPVNNPYRFRRSDAMTEKIREVYSYEWTDEEI